MIAKETRTKPNLRDWGLPSYTAIAYSGIVACVAVILVAVSGNPDTFFFFNIFVVAPFLLLFSIMSIALLIRAAASHGRRQFLPILATLTVVWAIPVFLYRYDSTHPFELHETARWLVLSNEYKREVLAQPASNGDFKHIEWDATGFAGVANNTVYLVFDPADGLSVAVNNNQAGKLRGIPCEPRLVRRLESHWYAILFYTDETWERCNQK
jgi:hypothetical protein